MEGSFSGLGNFKVVRDCMTTFLTAQDQQICDDQTITALEGVEHNGRRRTERELRHMAKEKEGGTSQPLSILESSEEAREITSH